MPGEKPIRPLWKTGPLWIGVALPLLVSASYHFYESTNHRKSDLAATGHTMLDVGVTVSTDIVAYIVGLITYVLSGPKLGRITTPLASIAMQAGATYFLTGKLS